MAGGPTSDGKARRVGSTGKGKRCGRMVVHGLLSSISSNSANSAAIEAKSSGLDPAFAGVLSQGFVSAMVPQGVNL